MNTPTEPTQNNRIDRSKNHGQIQLSWAFALALTLVGSSALNKFIVAENTLWIWVVGSVPFLISFGALKAYLDYLKFADELTKQIELEALAFGYGAGMIFGIGYLAVAPGITQFDAGRWVIVMITMVMIVVRIVFLMRGHRKYR